MIVLSRRLASSAAGAAVWAPVECPSFMERGVRAEAASWSGKRSGEVWIHEDRRLCLLFAISRINDSWLKVVMPLADPTLRRPSRLCHRGHSSCSPSRGHPSTLVMIGGASTGRTDGGSSVFLWDTQNLYAVCTQIGADAASSR